MSRRICFALIGLSILTWAAPLRSTADTILDDFQVNTEFPGHPPQDSPSSIADSLTQTIYTTWLSKRDGTNWDVALIRHNYDLEPIGEATYLNVREGTYHCLQPRLSLSAGGVGTAWIEARSPNRIYFRSLDAAGTPLSPPLRVEDNFDNLTRNSLNIASLTNGYLLVWYDLRDSSKIWAQQVDFDGSLIGPNFPIQPDCTGSILGLEAQNHPDGRVLVSWVTNAQYSRGRWLDAEGNFMGEVFEMAENWTSDIVIRSMVRFSQFGTAILYQYTLISSPDLESIYGHYLNYDAISLTNPTCLGWWYDYHYSPDWEFYHKYYFPALIYLGDSTYVAIWKYRYRYLSSTNWIDNQFNLLYSSSSNDTISPWGTASSYNLCRLDSEYFVYTYDPGYAALRGYNLNSLDSSECIVWLSEAGFGAPQGRSDFCIHQNGSFRTIYNNYTEYGPEIYTRHYDSLGIPSSPDTLVSMDELLNPVITTAGRIKNTPLDWAIVTWPYQNDILAALYYGGNWSGEVVSYDISSGSFSPNFIPNMDVNDIGHLMLIWNHWISQGSYFFLQCYFGSYGEFFIPLAVNVPFGFTYYWDLDGPRYQFDVALKDDGQFIVAWTNRVQNGGIYVQHGINYLQLTGSVILVSLSYEADLITAPLLEKAANGYWITWIETDEYSAENKYLYVRHLDEEGNPTANCINVDEEDGAPVVELFNTQLDLAVSDSSDNFAIVWQDARNDSGDIYCRQFYPDGSFFGREYRVNSDPVGVLQSQPAVAFGPEDRLYFTWTDFRNPGGQGDIYCKVIEWEDALYAPDESPPLPHRFALYPPSPNPFNSTTVIRFELPQAGWVDLQIFDISGREVGARRASPLQASGSGATPTMGWYEAGVHEVRFDGSGLASGIYIARLEAGEFTASQKLILLK